MTVIFIVLFTFSNTGAVTLNYDGGDVLADIYLERATGDEEYYTYMTWDLGNGTFIDPLIDLNSLEATVSFVVLGGLCEPNASISLIPNQNINLSGDSVAVIHTEPVSTSTNYFISPVDAGQGHNITISELARDNLQNNSNRYLTLRIQDSNSVATPNTKTDSQELKICNNTRFLSLGSSIATTSNRPKLTMSYNFVDPSNITVQPYEVLELPQVESNRSLDLEGLERTYLRCFWHIDDIGEDFVDMNSNFCPETPQNFTFTNDEDYVVRIAYLDIFYNQTSTEWEEAEHGLSGELDYHYNLNIQEPEPSFLENLWESFLNLIREFLCSIFPDLGFCEG